MSELFSNYFYFFAGLFFLFLAKAKHTLRGYKTPKPFGLSETDQCIEYDMKTVNEWLEMLNDHAGSGMLNDKRVLGLGPGSELALLSHGAKSYTAVDVRNMETLSLLICARRSA